MEENKLYYTLRYCHTDKLHKAGERIAAASQVVRIGQQEDCDVKLANDTGFADETFAVVNPRKDGQGWAIVVCSEDVQTLINGTRVDMVRSLEDGDHVTFSESSQELIFNVHDDCAYNPSLGPVHIAAPVSKKLFVSVVVALFALIGAVAFYAYHSRNEEKSIKMALGNVRQDVYQLSVNTIYLQRIVGQDTTVVDSFSCEGKGICGTAFLTKDSLIVTARHCIEPWLNDGTIMNIDKPEQIKSKPVLWALMAETYRQTHNGDTIYKVVSVCSLYSGDKGAILLANYRSDQFYYDDSRDDIIEKGDFAHEYYWRSLRRRHAQTDMMLGDVATLKTDTAGIIMLADSTRMAKLVTMGQRLDFIGYPAYSEQGKEIATGEVKLPYRENGGEEEMIAHNGSLTHGYSGGPTLVVSGSDIYAVGVISVTDNVGNRMYSVPATEVKKGGHTK